MTTKTVKKSVNGNGNGYLASPAYSMVLRLRLARHPGVLGRVMTALGEARVAIGAVDLVETTADTVVRDISIQTQDEAHAGVVVRSIEGLEDVELVNASDRTFLMHLGGKIDVVSRVPLKTRDDLSMAYTPGVARVCMAIHADPKKARTLTMKRSMVAVVTDGTAVLGLGDIGPMAALPVMEGKAMLFKAFGGVNAFPICLDTKDVDEIVRTVKLLAPGFGGINLEDISAPRCFEIERRLREELDIPVFHDDQHGTAVVVLAALFNSLRLIKKRIESLKVVLNGAGAAGVAVTDLLMQAGVKDVIGLDRAGALYKGRKERMNPAKEEYAARTNPRGFKGNLKEALRGADVFIGLSEAGVLEASDLSVMAKDAIVFALANPTPEVDPTKAAVYARIVGTGRSDYPNQINNALAFPGIFRGALDARARRIDDKMTMAAARAIADCVSPEELKEDTIVPSIFNPQVALAVAKAVGDAAAGQQ